eukprot:TRINITY_DN63458_c0_g1_i1.p1 TRINITY_DN63458_c0_g1~~TRINITY_DN63458_c0_g1_i1.p1  ORF type:complete len:195 (+),score=40.39 TRINITY_DN63458_c0_g1_i1:127-711(+)
MFQKLFAFLRPSQSSHGEVMAESQRFAVQVVQLSGDSKLIDGLYDDMPMIEFRERLAKEFSMANFEMQLMHGEEVLESGEDSKSLCELGIGENSSLIISTMGWARALVGSWEPAPEDGSPWMTGMKIAEDGTFVCKRGFVTDGLVRIVSASQRKINLKRTCADANDHVFLVDEDGSEMKGHCIQSGCTYTLTKQ